jgi:hypothetical protein
MSVRRKRPNALTGVRLIACQTAWDHRVGERERAWRPAAFPRDGHIACSAAATLTIVNADEYARRGLRAMQAIAEADGASRGVQNIDWTIRCGRPEGVSIGESAPSSAADRHCGTQDRALV